MVSVPGQWRITRQEPPIEISPSRGDGAVHFSGMSRGDNMVVDEQVALQIAVLFLQSQKVSPTEFPIATMLGDGESTATTNWFRDWNGATWKTDLRVVVWPGRAVVGTYVWQGPDDQLRDEGLSILASIRRAAAATDTGKPQQARSRWGRRRADGQ